MFHCIVKYGILPSIIFLLGCSSTARKFDPDLMVELRGAIRPEKSVYSVGEEITVLYTLNNASLEEIKEEVVDGSKDKDIPFEGYHFNAVSEADHNQHLDLKKPGDALKGPFTLAPNAQQIFCQNTFVANQPGNYLISFDLRWKDGKRVEFKPVTIRVLGKEIIAITSETDPTLEAYLKDLESPDVTTRVLAREKLKQYGDKATRKLIPLLGKQDSILQREATATLIAMERDALPALMEASKDVNPHIRMRSIYILGQIGDANAFATIGYTLLHDPIIEVRQVALHIVGENLADPIAMPLLIKALADPSADMRKEAHEFLKKRSGRDFEFSPTASVEERQVALEAWKKWWQKSDPNAFQ